MRKDDGPTAQRLRELEFEAFILRHKLQQLGALAPSAPPEQTYGTVASTRPHGAEGNGVLRAGEQPSTSGALRLSAAEVSGLCSTGISRPVKKRVTFNERVVSQLHTTPVSREEDSELHLPRGEMEQRMATVPSHSFDIISGPDDAHVVEVHKRLLENELIIRTLGNLKSATPRLCPDEEVLASRRRKVSSGLAALLEACEVQEEMMKTSVPSSRRYVTAKTCGLGGR